MKRDVGGEVYCEGERHKRAAINALQTVSINANGNKSSVCKKDIERLYPMEWDDAVSKHGIRRKFYFVIAAMLDRSCARNGKGLNRFDYNEARADNLYVSVSWMNTDRLRVWVLRFCKYRKQLLSMGIKYPECLFSDGGC